MCSREIWFAAALSPGKYRETFSRGLLSWGKWEYTGTNIIIIYTKAAKDCWTIFVALLWRLWRLMLSGLIAASGRFELIARWWCADEWKRVDRDGGYVSRCCVSSFWQRKGHTVMINELILDYKMEMSSILAGAVTCQSSGNEERNSGPTLSANNRMIACYLQ